MRAATALGIVLGLAAQALSANAQEQLVMGPESQVPVGYNVNLKEMRLVQFAASEEPVWITELEKIQAKGAGRNFMDITDAQDLGAGLAALSVHEFPAPSFQKKVKDVIKTLSTDGPRSNLETFTSFRTRYYRSETGRESQKWLLSKIEEITAEYAAPAVKDLISINEFPHSWGQNSILVKIAGSNSTEGGVVISAHQDSTNMWPFLPAPGADDDGSGTVTILEAYRALVAADFAPSETVWFHWYSAEEGGLLGSQAVAKDFRARDAAIKAQIQFDMTAWVKRGTREEVGVITDFVDPSVTELVKKLVDEYLSIPYVETKCGYACSDHASWSKAGYRSAFSIESSFENSNHFIHSTNDRIDISDEFSFDHILEFSKLAVAFAIELGGWE